MGLIVPNGIVYDAARRTARFGRTKFAKQIVGSSVAACVSDASERRMLYFSDI